MRIPSSFFAAATVAALLCGLAQAQPCSLNTIVGSFAVSERATVFMTLPDQPFPVSVPVVGVGIAAIDHQGKVHGSHTVSVGGEIVEAEISGAVEVSSDCTAVESFAIKVGGEYTATAAVDKLVIADGGDVMTGILAGLPWKAVWTTTWKRISRVPYTRFQPQPPCSIDTIRGTYAFQYDGAIMMAVPGMPQPVPVVGALIGVGSIGYRGQTSGRGSASIGGEAMEFEFSGSPGATIVNRDCTATSKWMMPIPGTDVPGEGMDKMVILDGGDEIWTMIAKGVLGAPIILGKWTRISRVPGS